MARWRKSRASNPSGSCVELAELPGGVIGVRNSRDPAGPVLVYPRAALAAFLAGARDGAFDGLCGGAGIELPVAGAELGGPLAAAGRAG